MSQLLGAFCRSFLVRTVRGYRSADSCTMSFAPAPLSDMASLLYALARNTASGASVSSWSWSIVKQTRNMSFSVPLCDAGARVQCNARRQGVVPHAASSTPHTRHLANVVHTEAPRRPALLSASERLSASTLRPSARQSASRGPVLASATAPQALQSSVTPTEVPRKQGVRDGAFIIRVWV